VPQAQSGTITITTTPTALSFTYQSGATTLPAAQTITLKASSGNPALAVAIAPVNTFWLTATPSAAALPASVSVRVNPTSLPVGQYGASVDLTVGGIADVVTVTLTVTAAPSTLTISPTTMNLAAPPDPAAQTVTLSTNGSPISYTATSGASWMTVNPSVGVVLPGDTTTLSVSVTAAGLAAQTAPYVGKITIVASGAAVTAKSQSITVNFTVSSVRPTITSIWPATLPVGGAAQNITIYGTNFYSATVAKVQGVTVPLATTVVSSTVLLAVVPASLLTSSTFLQVYAENPLPGGDSVPASLHVTSAPTIAGVFNAASYGSTAFSPGELVTIFGTNIGPTVPDGMTVAGGYVTTTSPSGVTVSIINGANPVLNAPILYAGANQVTVQIPYEAVAGAQDIEVVNGANGTTPQFPITVAATAPGIFTSDGSGVGQAAALNYPSVGAPSLNSGTNLATIGEAITLYVTGEGNWYTGPLSGVALSSNTGYIIPANVDPSLNLALFAMATNPTVTIGNVDATGGVSYAGIVPGSITGLLQINVTVPTGSATGVAVPVVVTVGGVKSQTAVTLGIHP
jgi:uncharacterized protein (TIGR03437 family)